MASEAVIILPIQRGAVIEESGRPAIIVTLSIDVVTARGLVAGDRAIGTKFLTELATQLRSSHADGRGVDS